MRMRTNLHKTQNYNKHPHTQTHGIRSRIGLSSKGNQRNVNLQQSTYVINYEWESECRKCREDIMI